ncbi:MAG: threonylcarbamoyl-AMP synthase [Chloroflexi bacterium]|nr:threonylcarbamoyl-AMP synthase [Chloroflexota bacterium]
MVVAVRPKEQLREAVDILTRGGLVAYPTDTVYGLGANAFDPRAVARVFEAKDRPPIEALPVLIPDILFLPWVARDIPEVAWRLAQAFWPGALTLVLPRTAEVPDIVSAGKNTVAVRVPDHPVPRALARLLEAPITGTSANISGQPSPLMASQVRSMFGNRVDLVVEGECYLGKESTIVEVAGFNATPRLVREGVIPWSAIQQVVAEAPPLWVDVSGPWPAPSEKGRRAA